MADATFLPRERLSEIDPWLKPYHDNLQARLTYTQDYIAQISQYRTDDGVPRGYEYFGLQKQSDGWLLREWLPSATKVYAIGEFSDWKDDERFALSAKDHGEWELLLPKKSLSHGSHYKLHVYWDGGDGERIPAWATYVMQDPSTKVFDAVVWDPIKKHRWLDETFIQPADPPLIYEAHIGMSSANEKVSTYKEFTKNILPRIAKAGYNTVQLMAIAEHPYYGSFGYHVSSFFAPSSRFGTPDDLRALVDAAHQYGLRVIMDIVHSHAVKNEVEGISRYDGSYDQFFHSGERGNHDQWDSRVFDYGKPEVAYFLLSNCVYWLKEFHIDGYRFDGVTSMLYTHHGLERDFSHYDAYFQDVDKDALAYLTVANELIHHVKTGALTIAEEMSGMPGIVAPMSDGGLGFDYRLSMGVPDLWIKYTQDKTDEQWNMSELVHELSQHRPEERTISYAESHDQALVGDKTLIFRLADKQMYEHMAVGDENVDIDRALALHKMIRLLTATMHHGGYLNFMGNEFGHPEWIDFPREQNEWSYKYARRQWNLADNTALKYHFLRDFDRALTDLLKLLKEPTSNAIANDNDHVICYGRGDYVLAYNFHPTKSYSDYGFDVAAGDFVVVLSTDDKTFGGFGHIDTNIVYPSDGQLKLYLPARTAVVLRRVNATIDS